jgi:hypothetical protein
LSRTQQNAPDGIGYPTLAYQGQTKVPITKCSADDVLPVPQGLARSPSFSLSVRHLSIPLSDRIKTQIKEARVYVEAILNDNYVTVLTFDTFGSRDIVKHARMGPDSFMQMCLALAFARDQKSRTGKLVPAT